MGSTSLSRSGLQHVKLVVAAAAVMRSPFSLARRFSSGSGAEATKQVES